MSTLLLNFFRFFVFLMINLPAFSQDTLRIMTHNVLAFSGHPKEYHKLDEDILNNGISFYRKMQVDLLLLQESPPEPYVQILADSLGFDYFFMQGKYKGGGNYPYGFPGTILSRYPVDLTFDFNAEVANVADSVFQRHLGTATLITPLGKLQVTGVHLCADWGGKFREGTRMKELELLFEYLPDCQDCIVRILAGDFNSTPGSKPWQKIINAGYKDTHEVVNYPNVPVPDSQYRIDYIFLNEDTELNFQPADIKIPYYTEKGLYLSDHVPCMVMIF